jgi:hypothetical protein
MKRKAIIIFIFLILTVPLFSMNSYAEPYKLTMDIFDTHYVTIDTGVNIPASYNVEDSRLGLLLTAKNSMAHADFKAVFSGLFELDFRIYEETPGLKKLSVDFESTESDEKFSVNINIERNLRSLIVAAGGKYFSDEGENEYIRAYGNESNILSFDPNTLTVSINGSLIWNFSYFLGKNYESDILFKDFSKFKVKIRFTDSSNNGRMLIYSLNGQKLSGNVLYANTAAPAIFAPLSTHAVKGEEFKLPKPFVYDVIDGIIPSENVTYELYKGNQLITAGNYEEDESVTLALAGDYTLKYKVKDSGLKEGVYSSNFKVFETLPEITFDTVKVLMGGTVGLGSEIEIPRARPLSDLSRDRDIYVTVDITLDGEPVEGYTDLCAGGFDFLFSEVGSYAINYSFKLGSIEQTKTIYFDVTDQKAALSLDSELPENVLTGTRYQLPRGTMTFGNETKPAEMTITYPSGAIYKNNYISFDEYGYYKLTYYAEFNGAVHSEERWIKSIHTVEGLLSDNVKVQPRSVYTRVGEIKGVAVTESLGKGGVTFKLPIDLSGKTKEDTIIELAAWPVKEMVRDYRILYIKLTDINDASNVVSIKVSQEPWYPETTASYAKVSHSGLQYVGVELPTRIHRENEYGYLFNHAFAGNPTFDISKSTINLSMDYSTKKLYLKFGRYGIEPDGAIIDLDSLDYFSRAWNGFSEGKCYLTVEAGGYATSATEARYIITQIDGYDLSGDYLKYADPKIDIDFEGNDEAPDGIKNVPYKVFDAEARNGLREIIPYSARVYYGYDTTAMHEIDVNDGYFIPSKAGIYTIEYSASDGLWNLTKELVEISVTATEQPFVITISEEKDTTDLVLGLPIDIAEFTYSGNRGNINIDISVKDNSGKSAFVNGWEFIADVSGEYTVTYTLTDYLGRQAEASYNVAVSANSVPVFDSAPVLLPVYTAGQEYILPDISAKDYSGNSRADAQVTIKIRYKNGTETVLGEDRKFVPSANYGNKFEVYYIASAAVGDRTSEISASSYIAQYSTQSGNINISNYFAKENINTVYMKLQTAFTVIDTNNPAKFIFAKPLLAHALNIRFNMTAEANNFEILTVTLTDSVDPSIFITLDIIKDGTRSKARLNNAEKTTYMAGSFWGNDENDGSTYDFQIIYSNSDYLIKDSVLNNIAGIQNDANGRPFNGFTSNRVYVSFEFKNVTGASSVLLYSINNQYMGNTSTDNFAPVIAVLGEYGGMTAFNSTAIIPAAEAEDVLAYTNGTKVTVLMPDGTPATSTDGVLLSNADASREYTVRFNKIGKYSIQYSATDSNNNEVKTLPKTAYVIDEVIPSYSLKSKVPETGSIDKEIVVPDININQVAGKTISYYIILLNPYYEQTLLYSSNNENQDKISFTPSVEGEYILRYYVFDQYYNYSIQDYVITVN